jgi:hypothetical protein
MVWLPMAVHAAEAPAQSQAINVRTLGAKGNGVTW